MGHKLLVADDSVTIQKVIKLALSSEGYEISAVSGGSELMAALKQNVPDIVLIDVSLPGMNAYAIKKEANQTPELSAVRFVLMYSAFEKIDENQAEKLKFDGRLIKPFDPSNLRKLMADLLMAKNFSVPPPIDLSTEETGEIELNATPTPPPLMGLENLPPVSQMASHTTLTRDSVSLDLPLAEQLLDSPAASEFAHMEHTDAQNIDLNVGLSDRTRFTELHQPAHDIRSLTNSTMQHISGIDTGVGGWSVDDSRKLKIDEPSKLMNMPTKPIDDGGSTFLTRPNPTVSTTTSAPPEHTESTGAATLASQMSGVIHQISGDLEEMIRRDLEKSLQPTLEKIIRETIPVIAEGLIKKEIDRILAED